MVAYTPEFCLPYFEETDSPCVDIGQVCAPESVWCAMAALIDAALVESSETLARTAESFPYAQVSVIPPLTLSASGSSSAASMITWDSVLGDSDNMVDLTVDPNTIYLRRSGIWQITAVVEAISSVNDTEIQFRLISPGSPSIITTSSSVRRLWFDPVAGLGSLFATPIGEAVTYDMFFLVDVSAGPVGLQGEVGFNSSGVAITITFNDIRFTARWVADTP